MLPVARSSGLLTRAALQRLCCPVLTTPAHAAEDSRRKENHLEYNCCLRTCQRLLKWDGDAGRSSHSGFCSSHFFLRFRHVRQPVLVRLLKLRLRFLGSCWRMESPLWSDPYEPPYMFNDRSSVSGLVLG